MAFAALLLTNPEAPSDVLLLIHKILDAKPQGLRVLLVCWLSVPLLCSSNVLLLAPSGLSNSRPRRRVIHSLKNAADQCRLWSMRMPRS
jgi:hypothetical protein